MSYVHVSAYSLSRLFILQGVVCYASDAVYHTIQVVAVSQTYSTSQWLIPQVRKRRVDDTYVALQTCPATQVLYLGSVGTQPR